MNRKDAALFLFLSAIWGSSFLFIKLGLLGGFGPLTLVSLRLLFGTIVMWLLVFRQGLRAPRQLSVLLMIAFLALINNTIPFTLITWGEQYIDSGMAAILNSTVPLFAALLSHFALADEPLTVRRVAGVMLGFVGVIVLFAPDLAGWSGGSRLAGQVAVIVASAGYAGGSVLTRKYLRGIEPSLLSAMQLGFALLWILGAALLFESPWAASPDPIAWFSALWLGILGTGLAYLLFFMLIRDIGATPTTMVTYIIPLFALVFGVLFLQEQLRWEYLVAMALIFLGVWLVNARRK